MHIFHTIWALVWKVVEQTCGHLVWATATFTFSAHVTGRSSTCLSKKCCCSLLSAKFQNSSSSFHPRWYFWAIQLAWRGTAGFHCSAWDQFAPYWDVGQSRISQLFPWISSPIAPISFPFSAPHLGLFLSCSVTILYLFFCLLFIIAFFHSCFFSPHGMFFLITYTILFLLSISFSLLNCCLPTTCICHWLFSSTVSIACFSPSNDFFATVNSRNLQGFVSGVAKTNKNWTVRNCDKCINLFWTLQTRESNNLRATKRQVLLLSLNGQKKNQNSRGNTASSALVAVLVQDIYWIHLVAKLQLRLYS